MKIGAKLAIGFGAVLTLVVLIGVIGVMQIGTITQDYGVKFKAFQDTGMYSDELIGEVLQVRRSEKDFIARLDKKYVDLVYSHIDSGKSIADIIIGLNVDPKVVDLAKDIQKDFDGYRSGFEELVAAYEIQGMDETLGLQGSFRNAAHDVEKTLQESNLQQAEVAYLTMRKHEKDYMLRKNEKYIKKNATEIQNIRTIVAASSLTSANKTRINNSLSKYASDFENLVMEYGVIDKTLKNIKGYADRAIDDAEQLEEVSTATGAVAEATINESAATSKTMMWVLIVLSALIGIGFAYFLTRSIVKPLEKAVETARKMAVGDLGMTIDVNGKDETAILLGAMKEMVEANRDVAQAAEKIADGDLGVKLEARSKEDTLLIALARMVGNLTDVINNVRLSADNVASGRA